MQYVGTGWSSTSKARLILIWYTKLCKRVTLWVAENVKNQDLTKLGNISKFLKFVDGRAYYPVCLTEVFGHTS